MITNRWQHTLFIALCIGVMGHHLLMMIGPNASAAFERVEPPPEDVQALAYGDIELALSALTFDDHGQVMINAKTESKLGVAVAQLPYPISDSQLTRLKHLLRRQWPDERGKAVVELFQVYFQFKQREMHWRESLSPPQTLEQDIQQFEVLKKMQNQWLGLSLANQLYGEQRRLAEYLYTTRQIESDRSLSQAQRQEKTRRALQSFQQDQIDSSSR